MAALEESDDGTYAPNRHSFSNNIPVYGNDVANPHEPTIGQDFTFGIDVVGNSQDTTDDPWEERESEIETEEPNNVADAGITPWNSGYNQDDQLETFTSTVILPSTPLARSAISLYLDYLNYSERAPSQVHFNNYLPPIVYQLDSTKSHDAYHHSHSKNTRQPSFPVYRDPLNDPQQPQLHRPIVPAPAHVLQPRLIHHLNQQIFDKPTVTQMNHMKDTSASSSTDRAAQQEWSQNEKDLLQRLAHQWWYWKDNDKLDTQACTGAALLRFFEHEFAANGFARTVHQLKNQWSRHGRTEFGRQEQRPSGRRSSTSLVTSARPNAKQKTETEHGRKRSIAEVYHDEDEEEKEAGF